MAYKIVRFFERDHPNQTVKKGLTLEEAKKHCNDKESSSKTCTTPEGKARTKQYGPWFDGFTQE